MDQIGPNIATAIVFNFVNKLFPVMAELLLHVPDNKLDFFIQLAKELNVRIVEERPSNKTLTVKQKKWVEGLKSALDEFEQHKQGKIKLRTAEELLNEF